MGTYIFQGWSGRADVCGSCSLKTLATPQLQGEFNELEKRWLLMTELNGLKHRKNCETALFKVRIVDNVFCRKEGRKEGQKGKKKRKERKEKRKGRKKGKEGKKERKERKEKRKERKEKKKRKERKEKKEKRK